MDQPAPLDTLVLPVNLVHHGWVRARNLLMVPLRCVDHWVYKSHLVCKNTRNCILCNAGDDKLKQVGLAEKRAERLMYRRVWHINQGALPSAPVEVSETGLDPAEHRQVYSSTKLKTYSVLN